jgi:Fic family protein
MEPRLKRIVAKKPQLDRLRPLSKAAIQNLEDWLKVELTYSSNAIEGNTLTRLETAEILEKGVAVTLNAKPLRDQLEAINHAKALDFVKMLAGKRKTHQDIREADILAIHKLILTCINDEWAGKFRQSEFFVRGASVIFPPPQNISYEMDEFMAWLERTQGEHPVKVAADAHYKLVTIHPFVDGNGRTARLLMNLILAIHNYPMAIIRNEERSAYLEAVNHGQTKGDLTAFYALIETAVERSLDAYLAASYGKSAMKTLSARQRTAQSKTLKIGELAQATNETVHTLRFWTKQGLLEIVGQSKGGYQLYSPAMIDRAQKIRQLQTAKRLTLHEIQEELKRAS